MSAGSTVTAPDFTDRLRAALWCAGERGWHMLGLNGKNPAATGRDWESKASTEAEQITLWMLDDLNPGIACGPSGLLVVDEDRAGGLAEYAASIGESVPNTFTVTTGKGQHFYFDRGRQHLTNGAGPLKAFGIDVRGIGGCVAAPGAVHENGRIYTPADAGAEVAPMPAWLVGALVAPHSTPGTEDHPWTDPPKHGLDALPDVIRGPRRDAPGERHSMLLSYAGGLRTRGFTFSEAESAFSRAWERCEQPPTCTTPLAWQEARTDLLVDVFTRYSAPAPTDPAITYATDLAAAVELETYRLRVRDRGRIKYDEEKAESEVAPSFDAGLLVEVLARPEEPANRVEGLIPTEGATLIVAQRKTGKTTFELNLARSLIIGEAFLGRFAVRPIAGRVGFLNFEVSAAQLARWAHDVGVPEDQLYLVNMRGRRNPFTNKKDKTLLAERLVEHGVESLIIDPFGRAYPGTNQNDAGEVGAFLADLDRFARGEAGVSDVILSAHAGWAGERTRGASALEDWADSVITIVRGTDDQSQRFMRAEGRDVLVEEDGLHFDPTTRRLTLSGAGSRKNAAKTRHLDELIPMVVAVVAAHPMITGNKIGAKLREDDVAFQKGDEQKAASLAVDRGLLRAQPGSHGARCYSVPEDVSGARPPRPPRDLPTGETNVLPDLPYTGEDVLGEDKTVVLPGCSVCGITTGLLPFADADGTITHGCRQHNPIITESHQSETNDEQEKR